jgi:hypothetical protein
MSILDRSEFEVNSPPKERKPGRPLAIAPELEPIVVELYRRGYGYRSIARVLREEYGASPSFTTVKRLLLKLKVELHDNNVSLLNGKNPV